MLFERIKRILRQSDDRASVGEAGERAAERLLRQKGYKVLARNWRKGKDEVDLVCMDGGVLVFVETRTRVAGALVGGFDSIDSRKKKALKRVCMGYLFQLRNPPESIRFDVVEVEHEAGNIKEARHFDDVPLFSKSLNRGR